MKEVKYNQVILCRVGTRQHGGLAFVSLFPSRGLFVFLSPYFPPPFITVYPSCSFLSGLLDIVHSSCYVWFGAVSC